MEEIFNKLIDTCVDNGYTDEEIELIKKAYSFALNQHEGMKRKTEKSI